MTNLHNHKDFKRSKPVDWKTENLSLDTIPSGKISYGAIDVFEDRIGRRLRLPVIAIRGREPGPILGLTAAVHGNEINGIPAIHRLAESIEVGNLSGTIIAIPIVNLPGYLAYQREFTDGADLNRIMPGEIPGTPSQVYAHNFVEKILAKFDYLVDLHTASFGRINSHYIRADFSNPVVKKLALLQHADIIVNKATPDTPGSGKSVRQVANDLNIPAITVELGNPQIFQSHIVNNAIKGICNIMVSLNMLDEEIITPPTQPVVCSRSYWTRVNDGGVLRVHPELVDLITKGDEMATLYDIYGREEITYEVPESGVVIGKNVNPVVSTGDRILHLGIIE